MNELARIDAEPGASRWRRHLAELRNMLLGSDAVATDDVLPFLRTSRVVARGTVTVLIFVVGFLGWAAIAPLQSAMIAPGTLIVESHRKLIQHLEGGIVRDILVREGQLVKAGQVLIRLADTQAVVNLQELQDEEDGYDAQEARLIAERDGAPVIHFPPALLARGSEPKVAEAILGEQTTFENRRESLNQQIAILQEKKSENVRIIAGLKDQQAALETQIALIQREADAVQKMVDKGLEPLPKLLDLQRTTADLTGQRGDIIEKIAQTNLDTSQDDIQIVNLKSQQLEDVLKDLRDVQGKRFDLIDRIQAARDVLNRTALVSPVAGRVVDLQVHTTGAVIKPGDTVLEIVPVHDQLVVEANIPPENAAEVHVGMTAKVDLNSYNQRRLPMITGTVTNVSADAILNARTGKAFFFAYISVDRSALKGYPDARLIPGMPVQVQLQTGTHTALDYFIEPIRDVMRNGMREK